jgi:hypothetical protein
MRNIVVEIMSRIHAGEVKTANSTYLKDWIKQLEIEIKINEGCNIRTEENDTELRKLYDAKCRCKQKLSIMKEGE